MLSFRRYLSTHQLHQLRQFRQEFTKDQIRKDELLITYSRSSGPGGQNVNKVNSKVDLRFDVPSATWIPDIVKLKIKETGKLNKRDELILQSDRYRTQQMNYDDCIEKLYQFVMDATVVPNETSELTKSRIKEFQEREKAKKIEDKKKRASLKSGRRSRDE
jgi:protein subunit release factor B